MSRHRLAILTPRGGDKAETFIRNHIDNLPFDVTVIHGDYLPWISEGYGDMTVLNWLDRLLIKFGLKRYTVRDARAERLEKILRDKRIEAVLAEYILTGAEVAPTCSKLGLPLIATGLGYELSVHEVLKKNRQSYQRYLRVASHTVLVARNMMDTLEELGGDRSRMTWSAAGPAQTFFEISSDCSSQDLFMLGRLIEKKAPHLVILAFAEVLKDFPEARLLIGGDGPLQPVCKDIVIGLGLDKNVVFLGRITQTEQQEILRTSRAFVQHSKVAPDGDSEGTPVAILEASAAGVPIISTLHSGIPDVVKDKVTGFLSEEGDVMTMGQHMKLLLSKREEAQRLGRAGKNYVEEKFSLRLHLDTLTRVITDAISSKS